MITPNYNAVIRKDGDWWIGWVEEVPGVNSQGASRDELISNHRSVSTYIKRVLGGGSRFSHTLGIALSRSNRTAR